MLNIVSLFSTDLLTVILKSDRTQNPLIINLILSGDMETSLTIVKALGQRTDLYMEDIIDKILCSNLSNLKKEIFIEFLLESLFKDESQSEKISLWVKLNPLTYNILLKRLSLFENVYLKTNIIRLIPFGRRADSMSYLLSESQKIIEVLKTHNGYLSAGMKREVLDILNVLDIFPHQDFLEICIQIACVSNQKQVVTMSRRIINKIINNKY